MSMRPRERVLAAVGAGPRTPDRPPRDLGGSIVTGINAMAYHRLRRHLGLPARPVRVNNVILMLAEVEEELIRRWELDVIALPRYEAAPGVPLDGRWRSGSLPDGAPALFPAGFHPVIREDGAWELYDGATRTSVLSAGSGSFVPAHFPLADAGPAALEAFDLPGITDRELDWLHATARRLYEDTDLAVFGWFGGSIFEQAQFLLGFEEFMVRLAGNLPFMHRLFRRLTDRALSDLRLYLQAVGEYIQVIGFGDDFGYQEGLQISPEIFRALVKPRLRELYGLSHSLSPARVFLHSCGAVSGLLDDLIEVGVDILNPVQTSAAGMEPERLKKEFGARICFWGGGADAQRILPLGSPEEVRRDVRRRLEVLGEGGGFVFAPIHNIQADVPPQNIEAMYLACP